MSEQEDLIFETRLPSNTLQELIKNTMQPKIEELIKMLDESANKTTQEITSIKESIKRLDATIGEIGDEKSVAESIREVSELVNKRDEFFHQKLKEHETKEAVWTTEYINNLPDSSFAYIEAGGKKDEEGKTTPRSLRHLPYKDAQGNIDPDHLRNALARLPQTKLSSEAKAQAKKRLCSAVAQWNREHPDNKIESDVCQTASEKLGELVKTPVPITAAVEHLEHEIQKINDEMTNIKESLNKILEKLEAMTEENKKKLQEAKQQAKP